MILVVAAEKGGTGKSAMAQNLAVWLMNKAHRVMLIDGDKQGTTADWIEERRDADKYSDIRFSQQSGHCREDLLAFEKDGYTVVMDCGGHDSITMRSAMSAATHILIPLRPKRRDVKTLLNMSEVVEGNSIINPDAKVAAVLNQCPTLPTQVNRILSAKEACRTFGIEPLNAIVSNRNVFDDADEDGASVYEFTPADTKAIDEINAVAAEFLGDK